MAADQTNKLQFLELVRFSGHPRHPPGWYDSGVKEISARNPSVQWVLPGCLPCAGCQKICFLKIKSVKKLTIHECFPGASFCNIINRFMHSNIQIRLDKNLSENVTKTLTVLSLSFYFSRLLSYTL